MYGHKSGNIDPKPLLLVIEISSKLRLRVFSIKSEIQSRHFCKSPSLNCLAQPSSNRFFIEAEFCRPFKVVPIPWIPSRLYDKSSKVSLFKWWWFRLSVNLLVNRHDDKYKWDKLAQFSKMVPIESLMESSKVLKDSFKDVRDGHLMKANARSRMWVLVIPLLLRSILVIFLQDGNSSQRDWKRAFSRPRRHEVRDSSFKTSRFWRDFKAVFKACGCVDP